MRAGEVSFFLLAVALLTLMAVSTSVRVEVESADFERRISALESKIGATP